jgi:hypothetical protein
MTDGSTRGEQKLLFVVSDTCFVSLFCAHSAHTLVVQNNDTKPIRVSSICERQCRQQRHGCLKDDECRKTTMMSQAPVSANNKSARKPNE